MNWLQDILGLLTQGTMMVSLTYKFRTLLRRCTLTQVSEMCETFFYFFLILEMNVFLSNV